MNEKRWSMYNTVETISPKMSLISYFRLRSYGSYLRYARYVGWSLSSSKVANPIYPTETKFFWAGWARVVIVPISCCYAIANGKQTSKLSLIRSALLLFETTHMPSPMIRARITCAAVFPGIAAMSLIFELQVQASASMKWGFLQLTRRS